jgi:hypothetical protein
MADVDDHKIDLYQESVILMKLYLLQSRIQRETLTSGGSK